MSVTRAKNTVQGWPKFFLGWTISFLLRLVPFRPPNIEPILALQMPFAKQFGFSAGFIFAFLNIVLFDIVTAKVGVWTLVTAFAYGFLALFSSWYFKNRESKALNYALHAVYATILYDALTGLTIGPLFFGQSFVQALLGQIPFTLYHLIGNVTLAAVVSPVIFHWVTNNHRFEFSSIKQLFFSFNKNLL
jgi:uncharacterized membrane protein